jgi:hypothetical protein
MADDDDPKIKRITYSSVMAAPGRLLRIFYDVTSGEADPLGDSALRDFHRVQPFSRTLSQQEQYVRQVSRPYFVCKLVTPAAETPETPLFSLLPVGGVVHVMFARAPRSRELSDQPSTPFDPSASLPIVVFDDTTLVPLLECRVAEVDATRRGAASGILSLEKVSS